MLILIRMELLKLRSTRWPMILAGVALLATMLLALQPLLKAGHGAPSLGTIGATLRVLDAMTRGALVALMVGALVVTSEFRHSTITASLLQVPERAKLVTAKAATAVLVGLALGVACFAIVLLLGAISGALQPELVNGDVALRATGHILTFPLYALLGAGIGALLHSNQPMAVGPARDLARRVGGACPGGTAAASGHLVARRRNGRTAELGDRGDGPAGMAGSRRAGGVRPDPGERGRVPRLPR